MINLFDYINEGLFSDVDTIMQQGTDLIASNTIEKWVTSEKYRITKKKNGYKLTGNFKMTWDEPVYTGPKIIEVDGNFAIVNSKLTNLNGIFDQFNTEISGTLTIEDNNDLVSLSGCPLQVGSLTITGNKSLKDIDIAPHVMGNAYVSKNGKRFKQEELQKKMQVYKKIFCSLDDEANIVEGELINEAFKAPQLKLVADAIRNATDAARPHGDKGFSLKNIMEIEWDKIDASQITELSTDDPKCVRLAKQYMTDKVQGFMVLMNKDGEVMSLINRKRLYKLNKLYRYGDNKLNSYNAGIDLTATEVINAVEDRYIDTVMFINIDRMKMYNSWSTVRVQRNTAQRGALALMRGKERMGTDKYGDTITAKDVRYYQNIADENRKRYDKMLQEIKAKRAAESNGFEKIKKRLDAAFARYTKILSKALTEYTKFTSYEICWLNDMFATASARDKWSCNESGLFIDLEEYIGYMIKASRGELWSYQSQNIEDTAKRWEKRISEKLDKVEAKLTELESR